jgi:hypothetical protein
VYRGSAATASVAFWRWVILACVVACGLGTMAPLSASAGSPTAPRPEELWRAYPLDVKPTAGVDTTASRVSSRSTGRPRSSGGREDPGRGMGPSWIAIVALAVGGAVMLSILLLRRARLSPRRGVGASGDDEVTADDARRQPATATASAVRYEPDGTAVAGRPSSPPAPAATPEPRAAGASGHETVAEVALPGRRFERRATGANREERPGARARNEPVCQIRWVPGRRGSSFYAAMIDTDGIERALAWSPRFEWRGPSPPEETAEAQAALRQLAKELRTSGWRPLRAKGKDFDEQRWYARRFRQPAAETEDDQVRAGAGSGGDKRPGAPRPTSRPGRPPLSTP